MVNEARLLVFGVILDPQDNFQLFDLSNFTYCYSFLYTARWQHFIELIFSYIHFITYWICINSVFSKPSTQWLSGLSYKIDHHSKKKQGSIGNRSASVLDLFISNTRFKGLFLSLQHLIYDKNRSKELQRLISDFILSIYNYWDFKVWKKYHF